jgi:hypothetical protein
MHRRRVRSWVALLLAPALALRLFVPDGFMASAGADGTLTMQMCHGDARSSTVIRVTQGGEAPADHGNSHEAPCAFAATAATAPPPLAAVALDLAPIPQAPAPARKAAPQVRNTHRTQSPRAPPSLA